MPKKAKELSGLTVSRLKTEGMYAVGGVDGLYLRVRGQSRSWILCVAMGVRVNALGRIVPRRLNMGLGPYPEVSLAEARDKARERRKQIRDGINPLEEKHAARVQQEKLAYKKRTFAECAEDVIDIKSKELKNKKHIAQWRSTLETYAYPFIGQKAVSEITKTDILAILEPIWLTKNETASRVRSRIENVLDYAKAKEYFDGDNPAAWKGMLKPLLPMPSKVQTKKHHAALPYNEIGIFMEQLRNRVGVSARALEFSILTVARSGEIRGAEWDEIDFEGKMWIIPAERMKARKEHRVPLSDAAVALLKALPRFANNNLVFPAPRGGQLSDMSLLAVLKRLGRDGLTQHGFRSTFRDWAGETTSHPREVIEHALAHQLADKAEAAYQRGTLWPKRVALMDDWTHYCGVI
ncbi:integrase arm-type DNA-binding domain-containing protein [Pectobacterium carotovorum subsp. carotovorum]|uniref:tyrosine-type recombinase/integrase n=1 Tax=Pectobacterium carotovorum TaxID=554 RepID=UPI00160248DF|nr:site-specific integrase [Pectobacterium carotovorum]MBB1525588.1 integrase arm-type DNA-binding domain-containing protein [Pectobacterium carotovorum subsp. carotovorum]